MDVIKKYYRLCSIKLPADQPLNIYNQIPATALKIVFTNKEVDMYFTKTNGYKIKENVIGGKPYAYGGMKSGKVIVL